MEAMSELEPHDHNQRPDNAASQDDSGQHHDLPQHSLKDKESFTNSERTMEHRDGDVGKEGQHNESEKSQMHHLPGQNSEAVDDTSTFEDTDRHREAGSRIKESTKFDGSVLFHQAGSEGGTRLSKPKMDRDSTKKDDSHSAAEGSRWSSPMQTETLEEKNRKKASEKTRSAKSRDEDDHESYIFDYHREIEKGYKVAQKKYTYFWKSHDVFSQWHPSEFMVGANKFTCAEQYMMYQKATLFESDDIGKKVLKTMDPREMKALGRRVEKFKENLWVWYCLEVVRDGSMYKYQQNQALKEALFRTYPTILVEASPFDTLWGIGLDKEDQMAWSEETWCGMNLLGYILTEVRDKLMCEEGIISDRDRKVYLEDLQDKLFKRNLEFFPGTDVDAEWEYMHRDYRNLYP